MSFKSAVNHSNFLLRSKWDPFTRGWTGLDYTVSRVKKKDSIYQTVHNTWTIDMRDIYIIRCVTRWFDNIWPFTILNICLNMPKSLAKFGWKCCQNRPRLIKFSQSGKFTPNLVTLPIIKEQIYLVPTCWVKNLKAISEFFKLTYNVQEEKNCKSFFEVGCNMTCASNTVKTSFSKLTAL